MFVQRRVLIDMLWFGLLLLMLIFSNAGALPTNQESSGEHSDEKDLKFESSFKDSDPESNVKQAKEDLVQASNREEVDVQEQDSLRLSDVTDKVKDGTIGTVDGERLVHGDDRGAEHHHVKVVEEDEQKVQGSPDTVHDDNFMHNLMHGDEEHDDTKLMEQEAVQFKDVDLKAFEKVHEEQDVEHRKKVEEDSNQMDPDLKNVELLHRSDRGEYNEPQPEPEPEPEPEPKKVIYVMPIDPQKDEHDLPRVEVHHHDDNFVDRIVVNDPDSHAYVVHKMHDYPTIKHDEI